MDFNNFGRSQNNLMSSSGRLGVLGDPDGDDVRTLPVAFFDDMNRQALDGSGGVADFSRHMRDSPLRVAHQTQRQNQVKNASNFMAKRYGQKEGERFAQIAKLRQMNTNPEQNSPPLFPATNLPIGSGGLMQLLNTGYVSPRADLSFALTRGNAMMHNKARLQIKDNTLIPGAHMAVGRQVNIPLASMDNSMLKLDSEAIRHGTYKKKMLANVIVKRAATPKKGLKLGKHAESLNADTDQDRPSTRNLMSPPVPAHLGHSSLMGSSTSKHSADFDFEIPQADMRVEVDKIRDYLELLDTYSLHHFIVWKGKVLDQTPEYASFERTYRNIWGPIKHVIVLLEKLLQDHAVPLAIVDGKAVTELALFDIEKIHNEDLFSCIANLEQIRPELAQKSRFQSRTRAQRLAAVVIQSVVRMFVQRRKYKRMKNEKLSAVIIQAYVRCWMARVLCQRMFASKMELRGYAWQKLQHTLKYNWNNWEGQERVVIHIPSITIEEHLRLGLQPNYQLMQNLQLARLCALIDPLVRLIYVAPFPLYSDCLEYLKSVMEAGGVPGSTLYARLHVVVPENADVLSPLLPLSSVVYYSAVCLQRIKALIRGRPAYIIPGRCGYQEQLVSLELGVPLLAADLQIIESLSTVSSMKRLFASSQLAIPIGAHDIYNEEDFIIALTKLIASNLSIRRWIFKIDADYSSMGQAYFDVTFLSCIMDLRKEYQQLVDMHKGDPGIWNNSDIQLVARAKILKALKSTLSVRAVICFPQVYQDWNFYIRQFVRFGGVIEAEPSFVIGHPAANIFISPEGTVSVISTQDVLFDDRYKKVCGLSPQVSVPHQALEGAAEAVGSQMFRRGVIGYVTVQLQAYWDHNIREIRIWGIGAEMNLTSLAASHSLFTLLCPKGSGSVDQVVNMGYYCFPNPRRQSDLEGGSISLNGESLRTENALRERSHYAMFDFIYNPCLASLQHGAFFKLCRLQGVSFDLQTRLGVVFMLPDSFSAGVISFMQIQATREDLMRRCVKTFQFMKEQIGIPLNETSTVSMGAMTNILKAIAVTVEKSKTLPQLLKASKIKLDVNSLVLGSRHNSNFAGKFASAQNSASQGFSVNSQYDNDEEDY